MNRRLHSPVPVPWVRVIIVNYNAADLLQSAVDGLAVQTMGDFEAVIVDNASTDSSLARLSLPDSRFRIVRSPQNIGFAAGSNLGARDAQTPWLATLNPDAVPQPQWLAELRSASARYADVAVFGSLQLMANTPSLLDGAGDNYSIFGIAWRGGHGGVASNVSADIEVFSSCAAAGLYRRDVFVAAGGFAECFFCYLEDVDLCFRLRLQGHRAMLIASARVLHVGSAIAGSGSFTHYHTARNGLWLLMRCMPWPLLAIVLPLHLASQAWLMWRVGQRRARLAGLLDGLRTFRAQWPERHGVLCQRRLALADLCRMLVWNPRTLAQRRIVAIVR